MAHALLKAVCAHRERPDPVGHRARFRRHEVRQAQVRASLGLAVLLAQVVPRHEPRAPLFVGVDLDVVAVHLCRGVKRGDAIRHEPTLLDDAPEHGLSLGQ